MSVEEYLQPEVPSLIRSTTIERAQELMNETKLTELPLIEGRNLITLVKEEWFEEVEDLNMPVSALKHPPFKPMIYQYGHPYEAAGRMIEFDLQMLPVLNRDELYVGAITRSDIMHYFSSRSGLSQPGGIIVISINALDYSLSEIARICENNDISILNVQVFHHTGSNRMEITLKTNKRDLQALAASFERYEYIVEQIFGETPARDDLKHRYNMLMNYLNM